MSSMHQHLFASIALLLVSKVPTLSLKRISISPKGTVFLLLTAGIIFIALLFYTFESPIILKGQIISAIRIIKRF